MQKNTGFTLIELMVVIAIIAILSTVVLAFLGNTKDSSNDAKIKSQLKSMVQQAQLFNGTIASAGVITSVVTPTSLVGGTLFTDTDSTHNGINNLISKLPAGTNLYYGWDGVYPISGGKWFVAASTSKGAACIDYTNVMKSYNGTVPTTILNFTTAFANAKSPTYSCQ